jgi:hypothetical protein
MTTGRAASAPLRPASSCCLRTPRDLQPQSLAAWLHGTHRWASHEHLPVYLDEYLYRHNRRATPMAAFQALLGLGALHEPTTYREITRKTA